MSAAVFQAYAESLEGARKYSNVVRVAWAGPTLNRLTGMYTTYVRGTETRGTAHIELSGNRITVTNEHNVTATGTYSSATRKITLTRGDWPDATPTHPFIGRVSVIEGRVRIDWCCTVDGNKSGGYWVRE